MRALSRPARPAAAHWRWLGAPLMALLLAACSQQELYGQLSERQANEMVAVLRIAGVKADKVAARDGKTFTVTTNPGDFSRAVEVLHDSGLPRDNFDTLGQVFKKEGFVSSPLEERARFTHALSQEISHTISSIDGVLQARVHVSVPEKNPLSDKPATATASVFIRHRPGLDMTQQVGKIKALVVNAIEGLPYDNVTVVLFPAESMPVVAKPAAPAPASIWGTDSFKPVVAIGAGLGVAALVLAWFLGWRQRRSASSGHALAVRNRASSAPPPSKSAHSS